MDLLPDRRFPRLIFQTLDSNSPPAQNAGQVHGHARIRCCAIDLSKQGRLPSQEAEGTGHEDENINVWDLADALSRRLV